MMNISQKQNDKIGISFAEIVLSLPNDLPKTTDALPIEVRLYKGQLFLNNSSLLVPEV